MRLELIIGALQYIMYAVNIHLILYTLSDGKRANKWCVGLGALYVGAYLAESLTELPGKVMVVLVFVLLYLSMLAAHGKQPVKTIYVTLLYIFFDAIMGSLVLLLLGFFFPVAAIMNKAVYLVQNIVFCAVFRRFAPRRAGEIRLSLSLLPKRVYVLILWYALILSFFTTGINYISHKPVSEARVNVFIPLMALLVSIVSLIIILNMIVNGITQRYYEESSRLLDKQVGLQVKYYEKIEQMSVDMRKFRHDYNNHMTCLSSLLESGKVDEAREYLGTISAHPAMKKSSYKSGNPIADAILDDKSAAAAAEGCGLAFSGAVSGRISAFDICTILSNALDNAIEACRGAENGSDKNITVKCVLKNDTQVISISNPSRNTDPQLRTTKEDKELHGFGLNNIRKTIEGMGGTMEISQDGSEFVLDIMFRVPEETA